MAAPDIPAALVVLQTHLAAAAAAVDATFTDVGRGLPFLRGRQLRYYWGGEVPPPRFSGAEVLNGQMVGERFLIVGFWPVPDGSETAAADQDAEIISLAGEIRTRLNADNELGGNVDNLILAYADPNLLVVAGGLHVVVTWTLDLAYVEYPLAR